jgi:hypothetical protein
MVHSLMWSDYRGMREVEFLLWRNVRQEILCLTGDWSKRYFHIVDQLDLLCEIKKISVLCICLLPGHSTESCQKLAGQ